MLHAMCVMQCASMGRVHNSATRNFNALPAAAMVVGSAQTLFDV